jgi:hypothetical protein
MSFRLSEEIHGEAECITISLGPCFIRTLLLAPIERAREIELRQKVVKAVLPLFGASLDIPVRISGLMLLARPLT